MPYFWQRTKKEDGTEELAIPKELEEQIKKGAEGAERLGKIEQLLADQAATQAAEKAEQRKATEREEAARRQAKEIETKGTLDEQIEALMLEGKTKEAISLATQGHSSEILLLRADRIKRDVFEDEQKFKYYHGDIKREVDALINGQPLSARNDPSVVENCYLTVLGKHNDEILEGKIKNRFAGSSSGSTANGSAGAGAGGGDKKVYDAEYTAEIRRAAKQSGIKYEDYVEMLEKEGVI